MSTTNIISLIIPSLTILLIVVKTTNCQFSFNPNHPLLHGLFYGLAPGLGSQYVPGGKYRPGMLKPWTTKAHTFPLGDKKKESSSAASMQRPMYMPMHHGASMYGGYYPNHGYGMYQQMMYQPQMYAAAASSFAPAYAPSPFGAMYGPSAYGPSFAPPSFGGGMGGYGGGAAFGGASYGGANFGADQFGVGQFESDPFSAIGGNIGGDSEESLSEPVTTITEEDHSSAISPIDRAMAESMTKQYKSKSGFEFGSASGFKPISFRSEESFLKSKYSPSDIYKRLDKLTS